MNTLYLQKYAFLWRSNYYDFLQSESFVFSKVHFLWWSKQASIVASKKVWSSNIFLKVFIIMLTLLKPNSAKGRVGSKKEMGRAWKNRKLYPANGRFNRSQSLKCPNSNLDPTHLQNKSTHFLHKSFATLGSLSSSLLG